MSKPPSASIIIDSYNYGRFLAEAIDSALNQNDTRTEVIVVDDGSTDNSREVIASYGDRIIPVFKENGGMDTAFNAGFARSCGQLTLFLDADDCLLPDCIAMARGEFQREAVVNVHWPLWVIDQAGKRTGAKVPARHLRHGNLRDDVIHGGPDAWPTVPTSGNVWASWFLQKIFPLPVRGFKRHAEMYPATLAPVYGEIRHMAEPLSCYRLHGGNDYAAASPAEKNRRNLALYDERCDVLAHELSRQRVAFDRAAWDAGRNAFLWMADLERVIETLVPAGTGFVLADENQWVPPPRLASRPVIPFTERNGLYNGPPADDRAAILDLERLRKLGASFFVFAWPSFWWLDHYKKFAGHLRTNFRCVLHNERLLVFDMRASPHPWQCAASGAPAPGLRPPSPPPGERAG